MATQWYSVIAALVIISVTRRLHLLHFDRKEVSNNCFGRKEVTADCGFLDPKWL